MKKHYSKDLATDRSLKHSVYDGAAFSVMSGGGETYFSAFAIYLKATTTQIAFLASVPELLASFAQLLSAWLGHRFGNRKAIIMFGALMQGLMWLPMALIPWIPTAYKVEMFIVLVVLYHAFGNLTTPQWASLMGDLVSERQRGRYFGYRTRISSMTSFIALVAAGTLLHYFDSNTQVKIGYSVLFVIAFIARQVSVYHLAQMHDPPGHVAAIEMPVNKITWRMLKRSQFAGFSIYFALIQLSVSTAGPFFAIYLLRDLSFSYIQFMLLTAASVMMQFLTLNRWGRISDIFGNRIILTLCGSLIPFIPVLWLISTNFYYLFITQSIAGFLWAGFTLSSSNFLYDLIDKNKRATYMAAHNVLAGIGTFIGAMLGGYLAFVLPASYELFGYQFTLVSQLYNLFIASFILRLLTSWLLVPRIKEMRRVKPVSVTRLVFRVVRFNPITGLKFEIITSRKKNKKD